VLLPITIVVGERELRVFNVCDAEHVYSPDALQLLVVHFEGVLRRRLKYSALQVVLSPELQEWSHGAAANIVAREGHLSNPLHRPTQANRTQVASGIEQQMMRSLAGQDQTTVKRWALPAQWSRSFSTSLPSAHTELDVLTVEPLATEYETAPANEFNDIFQEALRRVCIPLTTDVIAQHLGIKASSLACLRATLQVWSAFRERNPMWKTMNFSTATKMYVTAAEQLWMTHRVQSTQHILALSGHIETVAMHQILGVLLQLGEDGRSVATAEEPDSGEEPESSVEGTRATAPVSRWSEMESTISTDPTRLLTYLVGEAEAQLRTQSTLVRPVRHWASVLDALKRPEGSYVIKSLLKTCLTAGSIAVREEGIRLLGRIHALTQASPDRTQMVGHTAKRGPERRDKGPKAKTLETAPLSVRVRRT